MSATASQPAGSVDPAQLTFRYQSNPGGWITAQIVEWPEAISQGATEHEAMVNVLEALHDLTHEPTLSERIAAAAQARIDGVVDELEPLGRRVVGAAAGFIRDLTRPRVH